MWIIRNNNELYHYGVKNMKWGKHKKKMSERERAGRAYESAARSANDITRSIYNRLGNVDRWDKKAHAKSDRAYEAASNARQKALSKLNNKNYEWSIKGTKIVRTVKNGKMTAERKKLRRRVKSYNRKHKVKKLISNLFKKK